MVLVDPFDAFGVSPTTGFTTDVISAGPTVGLTGEVNRKSEQGIFGSLIEGTQDFFGVVSEGASFLSQFDRFAEANLGGGFLPQNVSPIDAEPPSSAGTSLGGIPLIVLLAGGGLALWLALR